MTTDYNSDFLTSTSGSTINFDVFTRDILREGAYNISIVSTLQNYNFNPPITAPTSHSSLGLNITNPCEKTNISTVPLQVEDFVSFAGYTVQSKHNYTFNDTESVSRT